ncbi:enoyl-CoA hydratase/isomerase family protein [Thalassospiraceae bacterium LMO-JJ14]|nr:enoyl-CoA hydratase/isomerase family protein [Thalassospiraceae bacterium LMO-JJ14]
MNDSQIVVTDYPSEYIARISLNRPEKRNALGPELREGLLVALHDAMVNADIRVLIITANGGHFSAGGDLASLADVDMVSGRHRIKRGHMVARAILTSEKPVVAAVEGYAMGAGAALAIACDTVVVDGEATLGFPFLKVGLGPDFGVSYTLPRRMGAGRAQHAFLHAKNFKGEAAVDCGLADVLAETGQVQAQALDLAKDLAALPPNALALAKRQFAAAPCDFETAAEMEAMGQALCFAGTEFPEGVAAFQEKRKPKF